MRRRRAREAGEELRGRAGDRVRDFAMLAATPEVREELGQHRELRAALRGLDEQALGR